MNLTTRGSVARRLGLCLALMLAATAIVSAGVGQWTSHGPYGGRFVALAVDPATAGTVYAGVPNFGVFKTTDAGATWSAVNGGFDPDPHSMAVAALAVDPVHTGVVYAGMVEGTGLWKTTDGGLSWNPLGLDFVTGLAVDPRNPSVVYAAAASGIVRSADGGATWQEGSGLPDVSSGLVMDASHPDVLYTVGRGVGYSTELLFRTSDAGATWRAAGAPLGNNGILGVAVDPASSRVFVATFVGVYRSDDGGVQWTKVLDGEVGGVSVVRPSEVYASKVADPASVYQSLDGGDHWIARPVPTPASRGLFVGSALEPATVYGASDQNGVIESIDSGASWSIANSGQLGLFTTVAVDPGSPLKIYAGSSAGLFRSEDGGGSWTLVNPSLSLDEVAVQPGSGALYSRLGRSSDGGVTWTPLPVPGTAPGVPVIVPASPQTMFAAGTCTLDETGRIFLSGDGGANWTTVYNAKASACVTSLVVSTTGADVYARIEGSVRDILQSRDSGLSWRPIDASGWPDDWRDSAIGVVAVDPADRNVVYASAANRFWVSSVGGGQWRSITTGLHASGLFTDAVPTQLVVDPTSRSVLYAATAAGVYRSGDGGTSWNPFSSGLPPSSVRSLTIDATGRLLNAATAGSVFEYETSMQGCSASSSSLCLMGGRFLATVTAADPRTGESAPGVAVSQGDDWGYFSLPELTGSPALPEITVKMADGVAVSHSYWLFYGGLTSLPYALTVVDTVTGRQNVYHNDLTDPSRPCGGADTSTFLSDEQGAGLTSATAVLAPRSGSADSSLTLLNRFHVTLAASNPTDGTRTTGTGVPGSGEWGFFSLPDFTHHAAYPEVFAKMVDATALPGGAFWFFFNGLTSFEYTLTVTDSVTGAQKQYSNPSAGLATLCGGIDTRAFHD